MKSVLVSLLVAVFVAVTSVCSYASNYDVYVSSTGTNIGPCPRTAPCATFGYAISQVTLNGVIHVVDQGTYGTVLITHGVTIDGGGFASNLSPVDLPPVSFIRVSAGASDVVNIVNFVVSGSSGTNDTNPLEASAIAVTTVGALHVEHCLFAGFASAAIDFHATGALLDMKDVTITDMQSGNGVYVANARATLEHVSISRTQTAVLAAGSSTVSVAHSTVNGNASGLVAAYGPTAELHIDDCTMTNNEWAVVVSQGATAYVSRSTLTNNVITALFNDGSSFLVSYGNNQFASNAGDGAFTSTLSVK